MSCHGLMAIVVLCSSRTPTDTFAVMIELAPIDVFVVVVEFL